MNAKVTKPEVAKKPEAIAKSAQPKVATAPKAPVAEKPQLPAVVAEKQQLQKPDAATGFADKPAVVALQRVAETQQDAEKPAHIKGVAAMPQKAKPQLKMLRKISWIGKHPGVGLRIKRWGSYKVGMTLQHCKETAGLSHLEPLFWVEHGLMKLEEPTEAEYKAALEAWQKSNEQKKTA